MCAYLYLSCLFVAGGLCFSLCTAVRSCEFPQAIRGLTEAKVLHICSIVLVPDTCPHMLREHSVRFAAVGSYVLRNYAVYNKVSQPHFDLPMCS